MTNNSQVLQNLVKSAQSIEKENERLTSEIIQKNLNELNKNLIAIFNEKLNSTMSVLDNKLNEAQKELESKSLEMQKNFNALQSRLLSKMQEMSLELMKYKRIEPRKYSKRKNKD
ncbi:hypothetical protein [Campylobacter sp. MIT 97-5078]|uniref:hypothetical protein n=1 Tax=Campylobacter sp. MIT 97-5078 TaxID=1548153 RepID=UPI0005136C16|nr:hypothetical protein [Campylobacter sp. MIT 97-5078]KGI55143.1 hypothetical protein LR59_13195 [Campylobacter sp. MIT 97-5078]TQR23248.1 hypothetical protein DMB91_08275 [Campylobacter sp. MIT 97-5078]